MCALFFDMPIAVVYMDEIIVFGYLDFGMHLIYVTEASTVMYLGFLITREGIKPQPEKV